MLLSIIIPQYRETDKIVKRLLASIDYQLNVPWAEVEVIIVNDGSDTKLTPAMLSSFDNIHPIYHKLAKNVGPGLARQAGLDMAKGKYVTFCDADDIYQNFGIFSLYFSYIHQQNEFDILNTSWLEELVFEGRKQYITHSNEATWMHGKLFSRKFLVYNNIRFSDKLKYHEDSYFLAIAHSQTTNVVTSPEISYVWLWDDGSITRRNNGSYSYDSFCEFITAISLSLHWRKDINDQKLTASIVQLIAYAYTMLKVNKWPDEYITLIEAKVAEVFKEFEEEFAKATETDIAVILAGERAKFAPFVENETFNMFINRVIKR